MTNHALKDMEETLAERELALRGIQRNYESLSSIMQVKQQEAQQVRYWQQRMWPLL